MEPAIGPMTDEQLAKVSGKVFHIPTVLGAVVPTYNITGITSQLKFSGDVLADIYLGNIKKSGMIPGWQSPTLE